MSVDLSDPEVQSTRTDLLNPYSPTKWFILSYAPQQSTAALSVLASGENPALPRIREVLEKTEEEVLFGYAEVGGKGLIVAFLRDNVGYVYLPLDQPLLLPSQ